MEGVILHGTANPPGSMAGPLENSCAEIDPNTKRYSPTNVIASFTGFACQQSGSDHSRFHRFARKLPARWRHRLCAGLRHRRAGLPPTCLATCPEPA
jgi:hypothetical protein